MHLVQAFNGLSLSLSLSLSAGRSRDYTDTEIEASEPKVLKPPVNTRSKRGNGQGMCGCVRGVAVSCLCDAC